MLKLDSSNWRLWIDPEVEEERGGSEEERQGGKLWLGRPAYWSCLRSWLEDKSTGDVTSWLIFSML